jgi:DNA/RNA-binding domain of Phe-tRNA-synthetase-like protein
VIIWSEGVKERFPDLNICMVLIEGVNNSPPNNYLPEIKNKVISKIKKEFRLELLKNEPIIRAYRDFYWRLGIDPTKIRPAGEALVRRILSGKPFPSISPAVDAYNLASIESFIALSGYDLRKVIFPIIIRMATQNDAFHGIGKSGNEMLKGIEIVVSDQNKIICIYPYRDSEYSKIENDSREILVLAYGVPGLDGEIIKTAAIKAYENLKEICGGRLLSTTLF